MKIYESCGTLSVNISTQKATIEPRTMLPVLKFGGEYRVLRHYNISSENYYGILCVLVVDGETNEDLNDYPALQVQMHQLIESINLKNFESFNRGLDFSNITSEDQVCYYVFHDISFDSQEIENVIFFQNQLELNHGEIPAINSNLDEKDKKGFHPKVGSGGILTVAGC